MQVQAEVQIMGRHQAQGQILRRSHRATFRGVVLRTVKAGDEEHETLSSVPGKAKQVGKTCVKYVPDGQMLLAVAICHPGNGPMILLQEEALRWIVYAKASKQN